MIACYRRSDAKARPQDEEHSFVRKPTLLYSRNHFDEDNPYVDSTRQNYRHVTPPPPETAISTATAAAATVAMVTTLPKQPNVARDRENVASISGKKLAFTRSDSAALASLNGIGNLDSAASSFNGFSSGDGPALPPAPPAPSSFSFPPGGPSFGQFGSSSFGGTGSISFDGNQGNGVGGGSNSAGSSEAGYHDSQPIIQKSVYVHVAPQEDEVPKQKIILPKIAPKKNYQIVFIKAPTPAPPSAPVIPPFPPQSDKTLIYVLHPKPEEAPPIRIPAPPQNAPVKPEVYFIKYKTKKEQEEDEFNNGGDVDVDDEGGGYHRRRYGRDGLDEEMDEESESLDVTDSASGARSSAARSPLSTAGDGNENAKTNEDGLGTALNQYDRDETNDNSGESSNIIRIYTTERGGKNTH